MLQAFSLQVLNDERSWRSAGFTFSADPASKFRVVLAEPAEVDRLCSPLITRSRVSCQNGNVVALNAARWRSGTADWDRSLNDYRIYLVNHEVGHLIGQRHPEPRCPTPGTPNAVMEQQTKGLAGCTGNPWPLTWELDRARARPVVLAPLPDWAPDPVPTNLGGAATTAPPTTITSTTFAATSTSGAPTTVLVTSTDQPVQVAVGQTGSGDGTDRGPALVALGLVAAVMLVLGGLQVSRRRANN
jgi:hypothetical protein